MKNLITYLKTLWSRVADSQSTDVSLDCRLTVGSPSGFNSKQMLKLVSVLVLILTIGVESAKGETLVLTFNGSTNAYSLVTTASSTENTFTQGTITLGYKSCTDNSASGTHYIMFAKGYGVLYNKTELPGAITNIKVEYRDGTSEKSNLGVKCRGSVMNTRQTSDLAATLTTDGGSYDDCDIAEASGYKYFNISIQGGSGSNDGNIQVTKITITYTAASCGSATPSTTGTASLNGSFNMTSTTSAIGVASGTWGPGINCSWSDYGFVWSDGTTTTTPTVSNNKVQVGTSGTATSWTGSVTPSNSTTPTSWTTGHTYYVRAYGKNNNGSATYAYGSAWSFTPYLVTFNKNDGGATTSTQYVQGGVSTPLTANSFSRTGYNFNGWNTDADGTSGTGYTNGQNVSLSANLTLYAKWTAKQCTVNFDIEGGTGTITSVTATYGQAMPSKESNLPTKTGYTFGGFWDGDGGTGTQYYNADGTSKINWNKDVTATQTLYAKWTAKSFTVTWMVNGETYSAGGSTSVDFDSKVAALPTPPTPPCGNKFMGWTTTNIGAVGIDKANTSAITALNLFTTAGSAPTISAEGAVTYYAVFADYAE